jgi:hypothetical protein
MTLPGGRIQERRASFSREVEAWNKPSQAGSKRIFTLNSCPAKVQVEREPLQRLEEQRSAGQVGGAVEFFVEYTRASLTECVKGL